MAFSTAPMSDLSNGWTTNRLGSGVCTVATWLIGILEP